MKDFVAWKKSAEGRRIQQILDGIMLYDSYEPLGKHQIDRLWQICERLKGYGSALYAEVLTPNDVKWLRELPYKIQKIHERSCPALLYTCETCNRLEKLSEL